MRFIVPSDIIRAALVTVNDEFRSLYGVRIECRDGKVFVYSTDSYCMQEYSFKEEGACDEASFFVDAGVFNGLQKHVSVIFDVSDEIKVCLDDGMNWFVIEQDDYTRPRFEDILSVDGEGSRAAIPYWTLKMIGKALKRSGLLRADFEIHGGKKAITFSTEQNGVALRGAFMPAVVR